MITYETLKAYKQKCEKAQEELRESIDAARKDIELFTRQLIAVTAQIETLTDLMGNPHSQTIEIPMVEDDNELQKLYDKRLDFFDGQDLEEFQKERQETVYRKEAMDIAETINAENEEEGNA